MGIFYAFIALTSWGVGDFLIQRSTRKIGSLIALFFITAFGAVVLLPFVYAEIGATLSSASDLAILIAASLVGLGVGLFEFEALRAGKISVIEPIFALEVPVVVGLAFLFIGEKLDLLQTLLVTLLVGGIVLISTRSVNSFKNMPSLLPRVRRDPVSEGRPQADRKPWVSDSGGRGLSIHWEKGIWYAIIGTLGMGAMNFLIGLGARETSPLFVNWLTNIFIALCILVYLMMKKRLHEVGTDWQKNKKLIASVSLVDNLAWIAYAYAATLIPIGIATGVSEAYIALAAFLGILFNKEKLKPHQWLGFIVSIGAAITLALLVAN